MSNRGEAMSEAQQDTWLEADDRHGIESLVTDLREGDRVELAFAHRPTAHLEGEVEKEGGELTVAGVVYLTADGKPVQAGRWHSIRVRKAAPKPAPLPEWTGAMVVVDGDGDCWMLQTDGTYKCLGYHYGVRPRSPLGLEQLFGPCRTVVDADGCLWGGGDD